MSQYRWLFAIRSMGPWPTASLRVDPHRERQAQDLDKDRAFDPHRPAGQPGSLASWNVGPARSSSRSACRASPSTAPVPALVDPDRPGEPVHRHPRTPAPPLGPDGLPGWEPLGRVVPLGAGADEVEHRLDGPSSVEARTRVAARTVTADRSLGNHPGQIV